MGLAGMGDLILTCTGDLSRNRRVGLAWHRTSHCRKFWKSWAMSRRESIPPAKSIAYRGGGGYADQALSPRCSTVA